MIQLKQNTVDLDALIEKANALSASKYIIWQLELDSGVIIDKHIDSNSTNIDFTGISAITVPEGTVKKIARNSDGAVLWEKPVSGFTVYVVDQLNMYGDYAVVNILSNDYRYDAVVQVPKDTIIAASVTSRVKGATIYYEDYSYHKNIDSKIAVDMLDQDMSGEVVSGNWTVTEDTVILFISDVGIFTCAFFPVDYFLDKYDYPLPS